MSDDPKSNRSVPLPGEVNRRRSERFDTQRQVMFSDYAAIGPLCHGTAMNMSSSGCCIETTSPEDIGTVVQLEVQHEPNNRESIVLLKGRVVRVEKLGARHYAMGIQTETPALSSISTSLRGDAVVSQPTRQPHSVTSTPEIQEHVAAQKVTYRRVEPAPLKPRGRSLEWTVTVALVTILVALFLLLLSQRRLRLETEKVEAGSSYGGYEIAKKIPLAASKDSVSSTGSSSGRGEEEILMSLGLPDVKPETTKAVEAPDTPASLLSVAQAALSSGDSLRAEKLFKQAGSHPKVSSIQRFVGLLGHARSAAERGERGLALKLLRDADSLGGKIPEAWTNHAAEFKRALQSSRAIEDEFAPMDQVLNVTPISVANSTGGTAPNIRIVVDTSDYVLNVLRDGEIAASFPVGLGRDGATPLGNFRVGNKITDPDWYNRGDIVLAGSPENPLGASWMGLAANEGDPGSIGIHPTQQARSIGQPMSRGCVRMRPSDAEALFRLIPLGTPITIHE